MIWRIGVSLAAERKHAACADAQAKTRWDAPYLLFSSNNANRRLCGEDAKKSGVRANSREHWFRALDNLKGVENVRHRELEDAMKSLAKKVQHFLVSVDGPTAVEYAVMLALIVIVCLTAIGAVGENANTTFEGVRDALAGGTP